MAQEQFSEEQELRAGLNRVMDYHARRKARRIGLLVAGLGACVLALLFFHNSCSDEVRPGTVRGMLEVSSSGLGEHKLALDKLQCFSGHPLKFRGVELRSGDGNKTIQIVEDGLRGSSVLIRIGDKELLLTKERCHELKIGLVERAGRTSDGVAYDGQLDLQCAFEGGSVSSSLHYEKCPD